MEKNYYTVKSETENLTVIERSKFICRIRNVKDEEDAKAFIDSVKKEHSLATHNCYAYIADEKGLVQKFSDDGEPQGTAGVPMLEVLKNRKMYKTAVVVTRYFGGVKLGAGGLVRAYSGAVCDCLDRAEVVDMQPVVYIEVFADYDKYSSIIRLEDENCSIIDNQFSDSIVSVFAIKEDFTKNFQDKLADIFSGNSNYNVKGKGFHAFKK
ncbi:MAG: YigZ family protein [Clostridiales bacterium]|nr:YigZ family protein [Clostridiales bacterium]